MQRIFPLFAVIAVVGACRQTPEEPSAARRMGACAVGHQGARQATVGHRRARGERARRRPLADARLLQRRVHGRRGPHAREVLAGRPERLAVDGARRRQPLHERPAHGARRDRAPTSTPRPPASASRCSSRSSSRRRARPTRCSQHFPCDRVLLGLQAEGQPCRFSIECKDGLACVGYEIGVDGTCKKPPAAARGVHPPAVRVDPQRGRIRAASPRLCPGRLLRRDDVPAAHACRQGVRQERGVCRRAVVRRREVRTPGRRRSSLLRGDRLCVLALVRPRGRCQRGQVCSEAHRRAGLHGGRRVQGQVRLSEGHSGSPSHAGQVRVRLRLGLRDDSFRESERMDGDVRHGRGLPARGAANGADRE